MRFSTIAFAAATEGSQGNAATPEVANTELVILTDADKLDSISKSIRNRKVFDTAADAVAYLSKGGDATKEGEAPKEGEDDSRAPFYGLPLAVKGMNDENGDIDESTYDGNRAVVATVGARTKDAKGKALVGVKGIVMFAIPTLDAILASDKGREWLDKIVTKEASHVAFRTVRDATTTREFVDGVAAMPGDVEAFVTAHSRGGDGLDTETFDALWNSFRKNLGTKSPALAKLLPGKAEVLNAIRSKAYAVENHGELEAKGVFERTGLSLINAAQNNTVKGEPSPLPTDALESWLADRDTFVFPTKAAPEKDFSVLDSMSLDF